MTFDGHAFRGGAKHHFEIYFQGVLYVEYDPRLNDGFKSQLFRFNAISAGRKIGNVISARLIRETGITSACARVKDTHGSLCNNLSARIRNPPREGGRR